MSKRNPALPAAGAVLSMLTLAVFFLLDIDRGDTVNALALAFILWAEAVLSGGLYVISGVKGGLFLKAGVSSVLAMYSASAALCALIAAFLSAGVNIFILIQIAIAALTSVAMIGITAFSRALERRNAEDLTKTSCSEPRRGGF